MAYDVTSWFQQQLETRSSEPKRVFTIGTSDYSERVNRWPKFKRTANEIKSIKIDVPLTNADGHFNMFHEQTYSMVQTCTLQIGFTHPTSGDELITIFTGHLKNVKYSKKDCILRLRDRMWDFAQRKVGDSDAHVDIGSTIPSDIAWTLCTCYGGLSNVASTSNPDIEYDDFLAWAEQFSADSVLMTANYQGMKITKGLTKLAAMTDSAIWIEGDGKLRFKRFSEADSLDITFTHDEYTHLQIDVESLRVVNKQYVGINYAVESDYWQHTILDQNTSSVNTFGAHENILRDESVWYVDSGAAINLAQRKTMLLEHPPKKFELGASLFGLNRQIGETIRLVDSFYNITSASGWRFVEIDFNMDKGQNKFILDEAATIPAFYLDVSNLDGSDRLL